MIVGFSHTHLSGTGIGDLADLSVMPFVGQANLTRPGNDHKSEDFASQFSHDNEEASPGYYSVILDKNQIKAELTATERVGVHRYTFPEGQAPSIIVNLAFAINWDAPVSASIQKESETMITGHRHSKGWARDQRLFYAIEFSHPINAMRSVADSAETEQEQVSGVKIKSQITFAGGTGPLIMKVGISTASIEGAKIAIEKEVGERSFDQVKFQENGCRFLAFILTLRGATKVQIAPSILPAVIVTMFSHCGIHSGPLIRYLRLHNLKGLMT